MAAQIAYLLNEMLFSTLLSKKCKQSFEFPALFGYALREREKNWEFSRQLPCVKTDFEKLGELAGKSLGSVRQKRNVAFKTVQRPG